ncbi:probable serine/threonine-protein kinase nek3 isoform X1 [Drosophila guanche]|nr:probable serine/threonine-protein kinase nek3 isoform X1 [Drosophila guanche]XP_034123094.1 probable serine/threonine-protein kinase nek3 isoform X1 [Drosophila guanche]XP_034123095.1 probable serine/threonine-protein kinase nek3 isoform X1 [Drosophila guanche]SPP77889.1 Hypothetical predicted protein [Drosophila guanche]
MSEERAGPSNGRKSRRDKFCDLLVGANRMTPEMSTDDSNSSQYNGDSPMNGNGRSSGKNKRKRRTPKKRHDSADSGLKGYTGRNPDLSDKMHDISDDSGEDPRSPAEIRALCASGLRVFPREQQQQQTEPAADAAVEEAAAAGPAALADPASPEPDTPTSSQMSSSSPSTTSSRTEKTKTAILPTAKDPSHPSIQLTTTTTIVRTTTITTTTTSNTGTSTTTTCIPATSVFSNLLTPVPVASGSPAPPVTPVTHQTPKTSPSPIYSPTAPANNNNNSNSSHSSENNSNNSSAASSASDSEPEPEPQAATTTNESQQQTATDLDQKAEELVFPGMSWDPFSVSSQQIRTRSKSTDVDKPNDGIYNKEKEKKSPATSTAAAAVPTNYPSNNYKKSNRNKRYRSPRPIAPKLLICGDDPLPPERPRRKSTFRPNASDEIYRQPFLYGWTRQVVNPSQKSNTSIQTVYTSPFGKKCRKMSEIQALLSDGLTTDNFLFGSQSLGAGPEFETTRTALSREEFNNALRERRKSLAAEKATESLAGKANRKRRKTMGAESRPNSASAGFDKRCKSTAVASVVTAAVSVKSVTVKSPKHLAADAVVAHGAGNRKSNPNVPKGASPPTEGSTSTTAVTGNALLLAADRNGSARTSGYFNTSVSSSAAPLSQEKRATCVSCVELVSGRVCQNCMQSVQGTEDVELDDEDEDSEKSYPELLLSNGVKVPKTIEPPGEMPPAELFSTDTCQVATQTDVHMGQDVVVIGGRKAMTMTGTQAIITNLKVILPLDLSAYNDLSNKRIASHKQSSETAPETTWANAFGAGFDCRILLSVMKTLNQQDRASVSQVSKLWNLCSSDPQLWISVSLRDTTVNNWPALVIQMARKGTRELDMMGAIIPSTANFGAGHMHTLKEMRVVRTHCTKAEFLQQIMSKMTKLEKLISTCYSSRLSLTAIDKMENLTELRIRMTDANGSISSLTQVGKLTRLRVLSLRGVKNLYKLLFLKKLPNLETLILGNCQNEVVARRLGNVVLPNLKKLQALRIETDIDQKKNPNWSFPIKEIMHGLAQAGDLRRLELVNVDVDSNFSELLAKCQSISELLLIPRCHSETNGMIRAVMELSRNKSQLKQFKLVINKALLTLTASFLGRPNVPLVPVTRPVLGMKPGEKLYLCSRNCHEKNHKTCVVGMHFERFQTFMCELMGKCSTSVVTMAVDHTVTTVQLDRLPPDEKVPFHTETHINPPNQQNVLLPEKAKTESSRVITKV